MTNDDLGLTQVKLEYRCPKCGAQADERWDCCQVTGSALPSPLAKEGEPVAEAEADAIERAEYAEREGDRAFEEGRELRRQLNGEKNRTANLERQLAAAEARADRAAEDERDRLYEEMLNFTDDLDDYDELLTWMRNERGAMLPTHRARLCSATSSSPEDQQKAAATPTIADPDGEARS